MRARVVFVGRGLPKDGAAGRWATMPLREFVAGRARAMSPVVPVLGDRALADTTPAAVRRAVAGTRTVLLAAPGNTLVEVVAFWARSGVVEFVSEPRLADRLRTLESRPLRVHLAPADWLPDPPRNPRAVELLDALTSLDAPRVAAWASRVGMSRFQLDRLSRRYFGPSAGAVCRRYVAASVAAERALGARLESIADALGYADGATLRRVLRRNAREIASPRRDPERPEPRAGRGPSAVRSTAPR